MYEWQLAMVPEEWTPIGPPNFLSECGSPQLDLDPQKAANLASRLNWPLISWLSKLYPSLVAEDESEWLGKWKTKQLLLALNYPVNLSQTQPLHRKGGGEGRQDHRGEPQESSEYGLREGQGAHQVWWQRVYSVYILFLLLCFRFLTGIYQFYVYLVHLSVNKK